ncbi:hypothetical protein WJX82_008762 [Trebouxia sp. C0006]
MALNCCLHMCPAPITSTSDRPTRQAKNAASVQSLIRPRPCVAQSWGTRRTKREHSTCVSASEREPPWAMTFDLRERETEWTQENKARLVTLFASHELGCDIEGVRERMQDLVQVLPDLSKKVHHMKPGLLAALLRDTHVIADRAVRLRKLLPHTNVSAMAAKQPELLLQEADDIILQVKQLRSQLGSDNIDKIVEEYPSLLDAELVQETLDELSRLMPKSDPKQTLLRNPSWVTKVERGPKRLGPHPHS